MDYNNNINKSWTFIVPFKVPKVLYIALPITLYLVEVSFYCSHSYPGVGWQTDNWFLLLKSINFDLLLQVETYNRLGLIFL